MKLSIALVFALSILGVQSRAQFQLGVDTRQFNSRNCICTPFYRCYDEETSNSLNDMVDDRRNIPVITVRQEGDPSACPDILEVCCTNLVQPSSSPTTTSSPSQPPPPRPTQIPPLAPTTNPSPQRPQSVPTQIPEDVLPHFPGDFLDERIPTEDFLPNGGSGACGVRNSDGVGVSIEGFTEGQAQYGEFPWMVALLTSNTGFGADMGAVNLFVGGGSLIDPQVVLTAAHKPFDNAANKTLTVRVGEWNFRAVTEPDQHQDIPVRQVIYHPRFKRDTRDYNYALLVLERPAILGETVGTICLPSTPSQRYDGQQCILSGWGKDIFGAEGRYQRILKSVSVNMVGNSQCQAALQTTRLGSNFTLHRSFICAGDQGQDACTGDGGSPLVCSDPLSPGQYVQAGVTSWGIGCGQQGIPGVYATVAPAIEWIQSTLSTIRLREDPRVA